MKNFDEKMIDYAKLILEVGVNLQKGEPLVVSAPIEGADFVRMIAKHAYGLGASNVHINWRDDELTKLKYSHAPMEVFENFPKWYADGQEDFAEKGACFISISAEDPELLKEADPKKIAAYNKSSSLALKKWMDYTMNDINSWCVVSIPSKGWAKRVFPRLSEDEAVEKLWDAIFSATRIHTEDPVKAWQDHLDILEEKISLLNEMNLKSLHYTSSNGTDLLVELPKGHIWTGGGGNNSKGTYFVANMPTEEVYTMPLKTGVNGVVYSTKPFNYGGKLIDEFKLVFKDGKVIEFEAKIGEEILKDLLDIDEGARYLGEVALVPFDSPISNSNIVFMNTLFDENASCHFALGKAYPTCISNGENMDDKELEAHGVNNSIIHEDFMVGTEDLSIIGENYEGEKIGIFTDGNWSI